MATPEVNGDGRPTPAAGLWRHKETGVEMIANATSKFGNPQGDAYARLGFVYVGPVEKKSDVEAANAVPDPHAAPIASPMGVKSVAELEGELASARQREAEFRAQRIANGTATEEDKAQVEEEEKAAAKAEKASKKESDSGKEAK